MPRIQLLPVLLAFLALVPPPNARAQGAEPPQWIWGSWAEDGNRPPSERCAFLRTFTIEEGAEVASARVSIACDDHFVLFLNGTRVGSGDTWAELEEFSIDTLVKYGMNVLAIEGRNDTGPAALLLTCEIAFRDGSRLRFVSDPTFLTVREPPEGWRTNPLDARGAAPARSFGALGAPPWGQVRKVSDPLLRTLPGFRVETVARGIGSILAITLDGRGGLFASREGSGIVHLTPAGDGAGFTPSGLACNALVSCHGLCVVGGVLYATGQGPSGAGLYRAAIPAGPSEPWNVQLLGRFEGPGGEHGAHGIALGPDGRLHIAVGNHHRIASTPSAESPYRIAYEGAFEPYLEDPLGHAVGIRAPGGTIVSVDLDGKDWRVFAGGFRNQYDLAFDAAGELFTFDSDMEWDVGLPWYRPVRVVHVIAGGEYGWRSGAACWPSYHCDSLPPVVETGRGSPTGVAFYGATAFPARFHGALLLADWSKGEILACNLTRRGTSYSGTTEVLLSGNPLPLTDLAVEDSGSILFSTGGRGARGAIHRLVYEGPREAPRAAPPPPPVPELRSPEAILAALDSGDRFLRFRAARALEERSPGLELLRRDVSPRVKGEIAVALARIALARDDAAIADGVYREGIRLLTSYDGRGAAEAEAAEVRLAFLRALELALQHPRGKARRSARETLTSLCVVFPTGEPRVDREIAVLLGFGAPAGTVEVLLDRLEHSPSKGDAIHAVYCLRTVKGGWTDEARARLAAWFEKTRAWSGGMSYAGYLDAIARDLKDVLGETYGTLASRGQAAATVVVAAGDPKDFDETLTFLEHTKEAPRRSREEGALLFGQLCARCHRFGEEGGRVGPDLTTVGARFSLAEQLRATLRPSEVVPDAYRAFDLRTRDGGVWSGLRTNAREGRVSLLLATGELIDVAASDVESLDLSKLSLMPEGLLDALTLEQVGDLFAYLNGPAQAGPLAESAWRVLFDGKTLAGWRGDPEHWRVEGGAIVGRASGLPGSRFLVSEEEFSDFVLEFDIQLTKGNSGLQFRAARPAPYVLTGYQADVGQSYWGSLYEEGGRGMLAQPAGEIWSSIVKPLDFNHYVVTATGRRIQIEVNGVVTVDVEDGEAARGFLGFQLHAGTENEVRIRNVRIRTSAGAAAPR